jgi:hypothetical protein
VGETTFLNFHTARNLWDRATTVLLQKPNGMTRIIEQNYNVNGATEQVAFLLDVPPIGINQK